MTEYKWNVMDRVTEEHQCTVCRQVNRYGNSPYSTGQPSILADARLKDV